MMEERIIQSNLQSGDFVIALVDMEKETPPIWRIQGKSLLQKFEPFEENGRLLYRNLSVYSGWTTTNRVNYDGIAVKFIKNNRGNCVVEYVRENRSDQRKVEITVEITADENGPSKECFEVFIQTMISQALDATFISEIIKENDEYFLCSVAEIEKGNKEKLNIIDKRIKWKPDLQDSANNYADAVSELYRGADHTAKCVICEIENPGSQITFRGEFYDAQTLQEITEVPGKDFNNITSVFRVCQTCSDKLLTYHRTQHMKYKLYIKCHTKVTDMKAANPSKESHLILEECLRDIDWMTMLYKELLTVWNGCDTYKN
jgi:hypothetical protein